MRRIAAHEDACQGQLFLDDGAPQLEPAANGHAQPAFESLSPPSFVHPRGDRRIRLDGHVVSYVFARTKRRSIGMQVGRDGLSVRAPRWVTLGEIDVALHERAGWIIKHLKGQQARLAHERSARIDWRDGATIMVLGAPCTMVLDDAVTGVVMQSIPDATQAEVGQPPRLLHVGLPQSATPEAMRDAVHAWLQREAMAIFKARCAHYAPQLGVTVSRLSLSAARTRWGSAGADGSVRLNWRLVHYAMGCIDYVVVHELSHLRHMNHGPAFWRVVRSVMPEFAHAKSVLRMQALEGHE